jgi:sulfopyruvate decarboxylase alpha subunit
VDYVLNQTDWATTVLQCLKQAQVQVVSYVPDKVLIPLIDGVHADAYFTAFPATREEEAIGIVGGAALGGAGAAVMMQSSGFGNIPNALASFAVPYQLPVLMIISERGVLGEFNSVQVPITRVLRPTLDALGIVHVTLTRRDEVEFMVSRTVLQCLRTQQPAALIISPLLTGGKDES